MRVTDWREYVLILLTRDIAEGRARICANPKCMAPYFVKGRKDARHCSRPCVVLVNVHKSRAKQKEEEKWKKATEAIKQDAATG